MNAIAEDKSRLESTLQTGQLLEGKYRVDYLVGQGGMAAVWAGTNERTGKRVALKVLLPSLAAIPGVDALFQREGLAASRVNHPNVVTVFDVIEHEGVACIVMELLDGEPLDSYLARTGPLSVDEAYGLLLPAMRGVASAHAQGVIHRDVKPQNIFVCRDPDGRAVTTKVLDFGISMIVERTREPATGPAPNVPMGTPAYMAPEHFSGTAPVDTRADVYGFGVMFYEALAGQVPFPGEPGPELYEQIVYAPAPSLAQLRPDVPAGLVRVIEAALAKEPAQRPSCVHRMIDAIEAQLPRRGLADGTAEARASWVEAAVPREKTGEHQVTMFMSGFPLAARGREPREPAPEPREPAVASDRLAPEAVPGVSPGTHTSRVLRSRRGWLWAASAFVLLLAATAAAWRGFARNSETRRDDVDPFAVPAAPGVPAPAATVIVSPLPPMAFPESQGEPSPLPASGPGAPAPAGEGVGPTRARPGERNASPNGTGPRLGVSGAESRAPRSLTGKRRKVLKVSAPRAGTLSVDDF